MKEELIKISEKMLLILYAANRLSSPNPVSTMNFFDSFKREWGKIDKRAFGKKVDYLKRKKFIRESAHKRNGSRYRITPKGLLKILGLAYKMREKKGGKLKNQYKMIMFDVPENFRKQRDKLRNLLKEIGFKELQKSVFVGDYDMNEEIELILKYLDLKKFVVGGHFKPD